MEEKIFEGLTYLISFPKDFQENKKYPLGKPKGYFFVPNKKQSIVIFDILCYNIKYTKRN